jgi:hypothetical protein
MAKFPDSIKLAAFQAGGWADTRHLKPVEDPVWS